MRFIAVGRGLLGLLCCSLVACSESDTDVSQDASEEVSSTAQAWTLADAGASFTWTLVGSPDAISAIAATKNGYLYALNDSSHLVRGSGADHAWVNVGYPSEAVDISVLDNGSTLFALNKPGSNWWNDAVFYNEGNGSDSSWVYLQAAGGASKVVAAGPRTVNLHYPSSGYSDSDVGQIGTKSFWINQKTVYTYLAGDYHALTIAPDWAGGQALDVRDVSVSDYVWALTERTTASGMRRLFRGMLNEVNCSDGLDNDVDQRRDLDDTDCTCPYFNRSGTFCLNRISSMGGGTLVTCSGSNLVGTSSGTVCVQVGNGGSDYTYNIN